MGRTLGLALLAGALGASTVLAAAGPCIHDPDISALERKCQTSLSKAAVKFAGAKNKCIDKCIAGAHKLPPLNPESDCFPPFGGATLTCIADPLKGAEAKAIAAINKACVEVPGKTDCPECYALRSGPADCSLHGLAVIVGGLSNPPAPSLEAQIDAFGFLYCNDGPNTSAENKCESGLGKARVKFIGCKTKCYDKCQAAMCKGIIPGGSCSPPSPFDPATASCIFDPVKGCEAKAVAAIDKACFTPPADAPECYGFSSSAIVSLVEGALDLNIPGTYCGSPSGAFLAD